MNILLVNDDGYKAKGIKILANVLKNEHNITVVAPNKGCSGFSHAMTFYRTVKFEKITSLGYNCYSVFGTPCDCVKFGVDFVFKHKLDLVIGGINDVTNLGTDYFYSGTVNIASEGSIMGVPSFAVSGNCKTDSHFYNIAEYIRKNLNFIFSLTDKDTPLSVNVQNFPLNNKGLVLAPFGKTAYTDDYIIEERNGKKFFTLTGEHIRLDNPKNSDVNMFLNGYSTITPIRMDWNEEDKLKKLEDKMTYSKDKF